MRRALSPDRVFFQAEDGIRDLTVTGVQTCALPISSRVGNLSPNWFDPKYWEARGELDGGARSEEHTSELQSQSNLVCRLLLEKKKKKEVKNDHERAETQ